jgi:3-hydroxyanthranilate 3,4-dioxygenase
MAQPLAVFNFKGWIDEHRHLLKPPVGNQVVYTDTDFIIMVVGGPNSRADYHINEGEEFFYQLEGNMTLKIIENGEFRDLPINEGDIMLLPPKIPHSPQRTANSVGLVVERKRRPEENDGFAWFCDNCRCKLHSEYFHLTDIVKQLPEVFDRYWKDESKTTCSKCNQKHSKDRQ